MFCKTIVDNDGNVIIVKGHTCEHCVTSMLLNINPLFEVIPIERRREG
jgi:hypothetical protein